MEKPKDYLMIYGTLVGLYSWRSMKYSSDTLNAFSGILAHLTEIAHPDSFFWGLPIAELNWSLIWCSQHSELIHRSGFPSWSWAGWQGAIHPGWPAEITTPHKYSTHFVAWKASKGRLELVRSCDSAQPNGDGDARLFRKQTVFDRISKQPLIDNVLLDDAASLAHAEKAGYPIADYAICDLSLILTVPASDYDYGPYQYFCAEINDVPCLVYSPYGAAAEAGYHYDCLEQLPNLASLGRERLGRSVYHHFLQLRYDADGLASRGEVWIVMIPTSRPDALDGLEIRRQRFVLT